MRTPRSTVGSYSNASSGVRRSLSSRATRAWRTPCAASSPASVRSRSFSEPSTLTKTFACARSVVVSHAGHRDEPDPRVLQRRERFREHLADRLVHAPPPLTRQGRPPPARPARARTPAPRDSEPQRRGAARASRCPLAAHATVSRDALPQLLVVDLRDRGAEALVELRLRRLHEPPLPLERAALGEMELDREDADVARRHGQGGLRRSPQAGRTGRRPGPCARPGGSRTPRGRRLPSRR